jgi:uncharacterized protein YjbI with pentapeptide repeats
MANPEHLEILKQGVEVWNRWRIENPHTPDLSDFDFTEIEGKYFMVGRIGGVDLSGINLEHANLRGAILERVNLFGGDLRTADLSGANLTDASLADSILFSATFTNANFSRVELYWTIFADTDLTGVKGLETCNHRDVSSIDFAAIAKSGNIPITFYATVAYLKL